MTRTKNYVAVYERDPESDAWLAHIESIPGCAIYGRTPRQAEARIREALAAWLDRGPDGLEIASGRDYGIGVLERLGELVGRVSASKSGQHSVGRLV